MADNVVPILAVSGETLIVDIVDVIAAKRIAALVGTLPRATRLVVPAANHHAVPDMIIDRDPEPDVKATRRQRSISIRLLPRRHRKGC